MVIADNYLCWKWGQIDLEWKETEGESNQVTVYTYPKIAHGDFIINFASLYKEHKNPIKVVF